MHVPRPRACLAAALLTLALPAAAAADSVVLDDQIVQGSQCVGLDCVNNESFGFDTLRLKENNTKLAFDDTSASAGFANNDWALQANDSGSGGMNRFMLNDVTGSRIPFGVMAGAPTDSLAVAANGNVGLGTAAPGLRLHLSTTDTPAMRLEQTNGGGFTAQTWDIGANEANFFVRDLTGGSRLPFRVRPGAPTSSVDISAAGNVGVGVASPDASLHVKRADGTAKLLVQEASGTAESRELASLTNNGPARLRFENTVTDAVDWLMGSQDADAFSITPSGAARPAVTIESSGGLSASGVLRQRADGAVTESPAAVDGAAVLTALKSLPIGTLEYIGDPSDARHLTPSPADFRAAFSLGSGDAEIAPSDMAAVALVAVKALAASGVTGPAGAAGANGTSGANGTNGTNGANGKDGVSPAQLTALAKRLTLLERSTKSLKTTNTKLTRRVRTLERRLKAVKRP